MFLASWKKYQSFFLLTSYLAVLQIPNPCDQNTNLSGCTMDMLYQSKRNYASPLAIKIPLGHIRFSCQPHKHSLFRINRADVLWDKGALRNSTATLLKKSSTVVFLWIWKVFKNIFFTKHLETTVFKIILWKYSKNTSKGILVLSVAGVLNTSESLLHVCFFPGNVYRILQNNSEWLPAFL